MENLENELQHLMEIKSGSVRAFAIDNDIPYTTLKSMLSRGVMATNVSNVITICKALNIKPESLGDDKLVFYGDKTIIQGDNNGMAGDNHGSVTINNAKDSKDAGRQKEMAANSAKDIDLQTEILEHIDAQTEIQKSIDEKLSILIELLKNKG